MEESQDPLPGFDPDPDRLAIHDLEFRDALAEITVLLSQYNEVFELQQTDIGKKKINLVPLMRKISARSKVVRAKLHSIVQEYKNGQR